MINLQRDILDDFAEVRRRAGFDDFLRMEKWSAAKKARERQMRKDRFRDYDAQHRLRRRRGGFFPADLMARLRPQDFGWDAAIPVPKAVTRARELARSARCTYSPIARRALVRDAPLRPHKRAPRRLRENRGVAPREAVMKSERQIENESMSTHQRIARDLERLVDVLETFAAILTAFQRQGPNGPTGHVSGCRCQPCLDRRSVDE